MRAWALFLLLPTLVIGVLIYLAIDDASKWEAFKASHGCRLVMQVPGSAAPGLGVSSTGQPVITTVIIPEQRAYLCDDNKTYWR
jgi:hypothetical protein